MKTAILVIDGNNIVFRAASVIEDEAFLAETGEDMSLSMLDSMLSKRIREMQEIDGYSKVVPIATFDAGNSTKTLHDDAKINRWSLFDDYKLDRRDDHSDPEKTQLRLERSRWKARWADSLLADGVAVCQHPGVEADDLMTFIADETSGLTDSTVTTAIWTMDKDLMQNVRDAADARVIMYRKRRDAGEVVVDEAEVVKEKGVPAGKIRAQLALQGDSADGYKAVSMYGGKRGLAVVNRSDGSYDSLLGELLADEKTRLKNKLTKGGLDWDQFSRDVASQLEQNWELAGCGVDYLPSSAIMSARMSIDHALGQI